MMRNRRIEFLRFIFAIFVLTVHFDQYVFDISLNNHDLFKYGALSVEFFFILSGFLMAQSIEKENKDDCYLFVKRKLDRIIYVHVISFMLVIISYCIKNKIFTFHDATLLLFRSLPNFLLIDFMGWGYKFPNINAPTWYLSVMFLSIPLIYSLFKKSKWFKDIGSFLIGGGLLGVVHMKCNSINGPRKRTFGETVYKGLVRGFSEMCLGVFCYGIYKRIKDRQYTLLGKALLTLLELLSFAVTMYVIIFSVKAEYNMLAVLAFMALIVLVFDNKTYCSTLFNHPYFEYLGKISLSMYLSHFSVINLTASLIENNKISNIYVVLVADLVVSVILAMAVDYVSDKLKKLNISKYLVLKNE